MVTQATAEEKAEGLEAEIDAALEAALPEPEKETGKEPPVEDIPKEGETESATKEDESVEEPQGEDSPEPEDSSQAEAKSDELLTRAVRAGMSLKDARIIAKQDAEALERQIKLLEKSGQPQGDAGEGDEKAGAAANADEDPLMGIPDLDPEVYDENIVAGFKALKSIIRKQGETIKQLSVGGERSWFQKQAESLKLDNAKLTELNVQFDALKAGYAATGQKMDDASVFQQATKLILGEDAKVVNKTKKLEKRANMQTARPGGPAAKAKGDPLVEVAEEVDRKFFK